MGEAWVILVPPFDILRVLRAGAPLWMEAAKTLENAEARVQQFAATEPRPYVIFSQKTANNIVITPDGDAVPPQSHEPGKPSWAPRDQN
jgi:hypothetical protein